jgi:PilZ domain-containing protein
MRILTIPFLSSAEFLSHYSEKNGDGALFCRTRTELEPQEQVLLEIAFPGLPNRALVRGAVVTRFAGRGSWIAFDRADASTRDFLLAVAHGDVVISAVERAHDRFPAELPVAYEIADGRAAESQTADVSASGTFIRCDVAPAVGTRVKLTLATGDDPLELQGEVTRARAEGFAVQFEPRTGENNRRLRALLRRASETGRIRFVPAES